MWNEEFSMDYMQRPAVIKKNFCIPYISVVESKLIGDLCCSYIDKIVDGNYSCSN